LPQAEALAPIFQPFVYAVAALVGSQEEDELYAYVERIGAGFNLGGLGRNGDHSRTMEQASATLSMFSLAGIFSNGPAQA
jgi:hypothetical protein